MRPLRSPVTRLSVPVLLLVAAPAAHAGDPCGIPLPQPGQSVTWDLGGSPYEVCQDLAIPAGGSVVVDPGVTIHVQANRTLSVLGSLDLSGTGSAPVLLQGANSSAIRVAGLLEGRFTDVAGLSLEQASGSTIVFADSTFQPTSDLQLDTPYDAPAVLRLDRCEVASTTFDVTGQAALREVNFTGARLGLTGYTLIDGLDSTGTLELYADFQTRHLDDCSVMGVGGPGIVFQRSDMDGGANLFVGPNVTLGGNLYPLHLQGTGLQPGSVLPSTGNTINAVLGPDNNWVYSGVLDWPATGIPYEVHGTPDFNNLTIHPGVTVRMAPSASLGIRGDFFDPGGELRGEPGTPITLEPLDPNNRWLALSGGFGSYQFEHLVVDGAMVGVSSPQATIHLAESTIQACVEGLGPSGLGLIRARGCRFLGNVAGAATDPSITSSSGLDLDGSVRPNVFEGNTLAVDKLALSSAVVPAESNWWGDASGPYHPSANPGGLGDEVDSFVDFQPWRTTEPDLGDAPPVVRIDTPFFLVEPGSRVLLGWHAEDDGTIVSQSILLDSTGGGAPAFQPVATSLAPGARNYEWTVPDVGFNVAARPAMLRIQVTDDAGNTSFDEVALHIPENLPAGSFSLTSGAEGPYQPDEKVPLCWTTLGITSGQPRAYLLLEADGHRMRGPQGTAGSWCSVSPVRMPDVSTDSARWAIVSDANGNRDEWFFSEPFEIRPSSLLGDAPPTIQMTSPLPGQSVSGGGTVPIRWTASDDEFVREIRIQTSTDGGRTWHPVASGLPGTDTAYDWRLPASSGIADARVRVIAVDRRFQNSSDGATVSFSITPGSVVCQPDLGSGGPGSSLLEVCGTTLGSGGSATLQLTGAPPAALAYLGYGTTLGSLPFAGGTIVPWPLDGVVAFVTDAQGGAQMPLAGGGGPLDVYAQFAIVDPAQGQGFGLSNAVEIQFLP